jgi:hypothetical protein
MSRASQPDAAKAYLRMAMDRGSADVEVAENYSQLLFSDGGPVTQREDEWAAEKDPVRDDLRLRKALWLYEQDEPEKALATLDLIRVPPSGEEVLYYRTVIASACAAGENGRAQSALAMVRKFTKAADQQQDTGTCGDSVDQ